MVYDWEGKEAECYRLYVEERKPLDEVMEYFRTELGFAPSPLSHFYTRLFAQSDAEERIAYSKRAFQTQFKRWQFPSKQNPAHKDVDLVARVKELWDKNTTQKDMLRILNEEGFEIKERELMRVRAKNRWLLRVPNGMKAPPQTVEAPNETEALHQELQQAILQHENSNAFVPTPALGTQEPPPRPQSPELEPEVLRKRQLRYEKLQAESDDRWANRKRRRRTRGWAGLPADPAGPPRFPSETTIDESKAYLRLDNELYRQLRDQFQAICEEEGVFKKTTAGPEKWQQVKDRLLQENAHLQAVIWDDSTPQPRDQKLLSLDVICTDVTKRMRTLERRMTIAEAKNALGINPEESRQIRNSFYAILKADHFTSKLEAGDEHWIALKQQWIDGSELLQSILAPGSTDPHHDLKVRAMEVLCRDVMKRLRDDQTRRDPSRKKQLSSGPGPGPAPPRPNAQSSAPKPTTFQGPAPTAPMLSAHHNTTTLPNASDLQIDPSLLLAAASDPALTASAAHNDHASSTYGAGGPFASTYAPQPSPIPVFMKLHPHSQVERAADWWVGVLHYGTVRELRQLAAERHSGTSVVRIEGVLKDAEDRDVGFAVGDDATLSGYLAHVEGGQATFVVQLVAEGYA